MSLCIFYKGNLLEPVAYNLKAWMFPLIIWSAIIFNNNELKAIKDLINKRKDEISKEDESVEGFNILINNGAIAGQTVFHLHFHLIPRRKNDSSQENFFSNLGKARS